MGKSVSGSENPAPYAVCIFLKKELKYYNKRPISLFKESH